jgi:hypothetical protein
MHRGRALDHLAAPADLHAMYAIVAVVMVGSGTADILTLKDGATLLGQVIDSAPPNKVAIVVRRAWAEAALPQRAAAWQRVEASWSRQARDERRRRLLAWQRERPEQRGESDAVRAWIAGELKRLDAGAEQPPLMYVEINSASVRRVIKRSDDMRRMLRQAWRAGLAEPESIAADDLKSALEGRGFAQSGVDSAPIDDLLPLPIENERRWLARRAATEVKAEPGLRYIRYLGLVLPESANADGAQAIAAAVASIKTILEGDAAADPLAARLADAARRGRVGLVVTRLDMAEDLSQVTVESALWIRTSPDRWEPVMARPVTVREGEVNPDEQTPLANDPQVKAAMGVIDRLGLGHVTPDLKERSLGVGAAVRRALGAAQSALARDLDQLSLPVDSARAE